MVAWRYGVGVTVQVWECLGKTMIKFEVEGSVKDRGHVRCMGHRLVNHFSVGVTLEVRFHRFAAGVNRGGEAGKILGYVARGEEFEDGRVEPLGPRDRAQKILKGVPW